MLESHCLMMAMTIVDGQYGILTRYHENQDIDLSVFDIGLFLDSMSRTIRDIHWYGIIHGDIKPSNILISRCGVGMLIDFGSSQSIRSNPKRISGTPNFMAPEIADGIITPAVDWYGLGVTTRSILNIIDPQYDSKFRSLDLWSDDLEQRSRCNLTTQMNWEGCSYRLNRLWTKIYISQGRNFPSHLLVCSEPNITLCDFFDIGSTKNTDERTNAIISMILYYNRHDGVFSGDKCELEWNLLGSYQDHYEWWWAMCQCFCHESLQDTLPGGPYKPTIAIDLATLFRLFLSKQNSTNEAEMPFWHCLLHVGLLVCESAPKLYSIFFQNDFILRKERNYYQDDTRQKKPLVFFTTTQF